MWYTQEKSKPYNVEPYEMNRDWYLTGQKKYLYGAFRMLKYKVTGTLEGYHEENDIVFHNCSCPPWSML